MTTVNQSTEQFETWGVLELMGHKKLAGRISEAQIAGSSLLRIDVPELGQRPSFTQYYGVGSVYCLTPTSKAVARQVVGRLNPVPISPYDLPAISFNLTRNDEEDEGPEEY
jgi:hypothetical protein